MGRLGRPPKANVQRDASGKSRGERDGIAPAVLAVRIRENEKNGLYLDQPGDALAGFTLGILLLRGRQDRGNPGGITQTQYDAGDRWASIVRRHSNIMGYELKRGASVKSPSFSMVGGGRNTNPDADDEQIAAARDAFRVTYDAIMALKEAYGSTTAIQVRNVLYAICIENIPVNDLSEVDCGNARLGLNTLARTLRV